MAKTLKEPAAPTEASSSKNGIGTFELTYPPRLMNYQWRLPRPDVDMGIDVRSNLIDFAKHLYEGPCPCYLLQLLPAHSGSRHYLLCWLYNAFRELEPENTFWRGLGPAEMLREHVDINRRLARICIDSRDYWSGLREDLSYRPTVSAEEFGRTRWIQIDEIHLKPGRLGEFAELQATMSKAYERAGIEQAAWVYEAYFGGRGTTFQIWRPYATIAAADQILDMRAEVDRALGDDGRSLVSDRSAGSIADIETTLYSVNPGGSYTPADVADTAPEFWKSRAYVFP